MPQAIAAVASAVASALFSIGVPAGIAKLVATFAVNVAISFAVNAASAALAKPTDPGANLLDPQQFTQLNADPLSDRVIIYGETGIAGEVVFQQVTSDRKSVNFVISIADYTQSEGHELSGLLIDGDPVTLGSGGAATGFYAGKLFVRFYGGSPTQTADATLISESGGLWTSNHRGRSCCYAVMKAEISDDQIFPNGRPSPIFIVKGRRVYDPRLDSTKPGGSGTHRIDDDSTWEWSDNAALCAYDYARGIYVQGRRVAGLGLPADLIDEAWVIASANACDAEGWTINGALLTGSDPADVLKSFAVHMGGRIATRKGKLAIIAGYDWPSVTTITEDDLAGKVKIKYAKNWREVHNAIKAAYRDKDNKYEAAETKLIKVSSWIAQDNGETFERTISLPFTHDRETATRITKLDLYRRRAPRVIECPLKLKQGRAYEGDIVEVYFPSYGISEPYEVTSWTLDQMGFVQVTLELWDAAGLEWSSEEAGDPPAWGTLNRDLPTPPAPDALAWDAVGVSVASATGSLPAIDIVGNAPEWVDGAVFEWREEGDSYWSLWGEGFSSVRLTGLAPGVDYEVSIRYRFGSLYSSRLILDVTTPTEFQAATINDQSDWATSAIPTDRLQYVNDDGRINDYRGLPVNAAGGTGSAFSGPVFSGSTSSTVSIAARTWTGSGGQTISIPSATISGLSESTTYIFFRDLVDNSFVYTINQTTAAAYYTNADGRYLALGPYATQSSGGSGGGFSGSWYKGGGGLIFE
jgi:hypothetical protein